MEKHPEELEKYSQMELDKIKKDWMKIFYELVEASGNKESFKEAKKNYNEKRTSLLDSAFRLVKKIVNDDNEYKNLKNVKRFNEIMEQRESKLKQINNLKEKKEELEKNCIIISGGKGGGQENFKISLKPEEIDEIEKAKEEKEKILKNKKIKIDINKLSNIQINNKNIDNEELEKIRKIEEEYKNSIINSSRIMPKKMSQKSKIKIIKKENDEKKSGNGEQENEGENVYHVGDEGKSEKEKNEEDNEEKDEGEEEKEKLDEMENSAENKKNSKKKIVKKRNDIDEEYNE